MVLSSMKCRRLILRVSEPKGRYDCPKIDTTDDVKIHRLKNDSNEKCISLDNTSTLRETTVNATIHVCLGHGHPYPCSDLVWFVANHDHDSSTGWFITNRAETLTMDVNHLFHTTILSDYLTTTVGFLYSYR